MDSVPVFAIDTILRSPCPETPIPLVVPGVRLRSQTSRIGSGNGHINPLPGATSVAVKQVLEVRENASMLSSNTLCVLPA